MAVAYRGGATMTMPTDVLDLFHPVIRAWFAERVGEPTEIQALAWPRIAAGEHVLVIAPTGSGKTLAAFLWALDRLLTGVWSPGQVRVLYVSPLKALGNDIRRNLLGPLEEIRARFRTHHDEADRGGVDEGRGQAPPLRETASQRRRLPEEPPDIRVLVRTGDTPAEERARMARRPPEILITTPESLNILLTSRGGRAMLGSVRSVILDEVHAVVGGKRGVHLITAIERLVRAGRRGAARRAVGDGAARSRRVAAWVGGWERRGEDGSAAASRSPSSARARRSATTSSVRYVAAGEAEGDEERVGGEELWARLAAEVRRPLRRNRSTLVFANSQRTVEKLTRLVNEDEPEPRSSPTTVRSRASCARWSRSGSRPGELRGIVATNSLELGIDIGALDEVVLVQTPPTMAAAVQRIGRAGHRSAATCRGRFLPLVAA